MDRRIPQAHAGDPHAGPRPPARTPEVPRDAPRGDQGNSHAIGGRRMARALHGAAPGKHRTSPLRLADLVGHPARLRGRVEAVSTTVAAPRRVVAICRRNCRRPFERHFCCPKACRRSFRVTVATPVTVWRRLLPRWRQRLSLSATALWKVITDHTVRHACGRRCWEAECECECSCMGDNHGDGLHRGWYPISGDMAIRNERVRRRWWVAAADVREAG
jgi:hypothetical protein